MDIIQHEEPAWGFKADFAIGISVTDDSYSKLYESEQLAVRQVTGSTFEVWNHIVAIDVDNLEKAKSISGQLLSAEKEKLIAQYETIALQFG